MPMAKPAFRTDPAVAAKVLISRPSGWELSSAPRLTRRSIGILGLPRRKGEGSERSRPAIRPAERGRGGIRTRNRREQANLRGGLGFPGVVPPRVRRGNAVPRVHGTPIGGPDSTEAGGRYAPGDARGVAVSAHRETLTPPGSGVPFKRFVPNLGDYDAPARACDPGSDGLAKGGDP